MISRTIALRRALLAAIAVLALAMPASAMAGESTLAIGSPANGSSTLDTTPEFSGTSNGTTNDVTVTVYEGFLPLLEVEKATTSPTAENTWSVGGIGPLPGGDYNAVATEEAEGGGTSTSEAVTFTVEVPPHVTGNPADVAVTAGQPASFSAAATGTPPPNVQWQVSEDGGSSWANDVSDFGNTTDTLTIKATTAEESGNEYRAVFTNSAGKETSEPATLTVRTPPVVTADPVNQAVTEGESAMFKASASGKPTPTVQWQVSTDSGAHWADDLTDPGSTTNTLLIASASAEQDGNEYRARFTNSAGEDFSKPATLTVNTPPTVTLSPSNDAVTAGEAAVFKAAASGSPTPTVQWQVSTNGGSSWTNDTTDGGNKTGTLTVTTTPADNGNEYRAEFNNVAGKATTNSASLEVRTVPVVTSNPADETVVAGEAAVFKASASGVPAPTVQWQVSTNGGSIWTNDTTDTGNKTVTLVVSPAVTGDDGNEYRAVFTNVAGKATSDSATLTVHTPPAVTANPTSQGVTEGETAVFKASASGKPTPSVQWQVSTDHGAHWSNDLADAGNKTESLTVAATTLAENGYEYRAVFTNVAGTVTTTSATLVVSEAKVAPEIQEDPESIEVTAGKPAVFTADATGVPTPSVQWQVSKDKGVTWANDNDQGNKTGTLVITAASFAQNGYEYRAVFSNSAGKAMTTAATLTVNTPPTVTLSPSNDAVTAGEAAVFKAAASGSPAPTVQWQVSTNGGSIWTNDSTDAGNKTGTLTVTTTPADNGYEYRAVFTNVAGEATSGVASLEVRTPPAVTADPTSIAVVAGEAATFKAAASGVPAPSVQWQLSTNGGASWSNDTTDTGNKTGTLIVSPTTVGLSGREYRAVFKNLVGTAESAAATLTVSEKEVAPLITKSPLNVHATAGQPATFTAAASGVPTPTVQWQRSKDHGATWVADTGDQGATSDTLTILSTSGSQNGNEYRAAFKNKAGEATTEPATLVVSTVPVVTIDPISTTVTAGETATFTAAASATPAPEVHWQESADGVTWTTIPGAESGTLTIAATLPSQSGLHYRAVFANDAGEVPSAVATLTVITPPPPPSPPGPPVASFTWAPAAPHAGEAIALASTSTDPAGPLTLFAWDVAGNGPFVGGGAQRTVTFATPGNHVVRLQVVDGRGMSSVASETIPVSSAPPHLMQPFPVVRIAGTDTVSGARISLLTVQAPVGATISISCKGRGCPPKPEVRVLSPSARKSSVVLVAFRRFNRSLKAGAVLVIRVTRPGDIGKYTSFTIHRAKLPTRVDMCVISRTAKPMQCPSS